MSIFKVSVLVFSQVEKEHINIYIFFIIIFPHRQRPVAPL